jgi:hypothetical protein
MSNSKVKTDLFFSVMTLLTGKESPSHVSLHQLLLSLLLSTKHLTTVSPRIQTIIDTLSFVLEDADGKKRISRSDFDYIF